MATVIVKRHDTAAIFYDTLTVNGVAYSLVGATVKFVLKKGASVFQDTASIENATSGTVSYQPGTGFPTDLGEYDQEWEVTKSGKKLSFPVSVRLNRVTGKYDPVHNKVIIIEDLNDE
jgi:hypothetical protein